MKKRSAATLVAALVVLVSSPATSRDPSAIPAPIWTLALLQSGNFEASNSTTTRCLAIVIAADFLLAQAHCVAQLPSLETAEFGVFRLPPAAASDEGGDVSFPESVPIVGITYHPDFLANNKNNNSVPVNWPDGADDKVIENDFAILQLAYAPAQRLANYILNNTVEYARTGIKFPNLGVLQVYPDTLEFAWLVEDVAIEVSVTACGFPKPNATHPGDVVICAASPHMWTLNNQGASSPTFSNSTKSRPWRLLFHTHETIGKCTMLFGITSASRAVQNAQSFLWPASGVKFFREHIPYEGLWPSEEIPTSNIPGITFTWLPP